MGWVVHRHGVLYSQEYGWDEHSAGLVAQTVADFIKTFDPKLERCRFAEREGVGSAFIVQKSKTVRRPVLRHYGCPRNSLSMRTPLVLFGLSSIEFW